MSAANDELSPGEALRRGIWEDNPTLVQFLGLCPSLAVTNTVLNALAMAGAVLFVLVGSSVLVAAVRKLVPSQVRITTFIVIIATFVTVADYVLQATAPGVHKELGAFIALIVVNCIILGRQEAFASRASVKASSGDAIGMSLGFCVALVLLAVPRELLGSGSLLGYRILPDSFEPWAIMVLPPGGFLTMGCVLAVVAWRRQQKLARAAVTGGGIR